MFKLISCTVLSLALIGSTALAQDGGGRTSATSQEVGGSVYQSPFSITPQVGVFGFPDSNANYTSRGIAGLTAMWDASAMLPKMEGWHFGLESGFLYSHLGAAGTNFFGSNGSTTDGGGQNAFQVPVHLAAGYAINDQLLAQLLVGSSLIYRSTGDSMILGRNDVGGNNQFDAFPSLGLNLGWSLSRNVGLTVRGDYIPVPLQDLYTASIGATIGLG